MFMYSLTIPYIYPVYVDHISPSLTSISSSLDLSSLFSQLLISLCYFFFIFLTEYHTLSRGTPKKKWLFSQSQRSKYYIYHLVAFIEFMFLISQNEILVYSYFHENADLNIDILSVQLQLSSHSSSTIFAKCY